MKLPFGKYGPKNFPPDGVDIAFINSGYLKWLVEQDWFIMKTDEKIVVAVEKELEEREFAHSHFYEDKIGFTGGRKNAPTS